MTATEQRATFALASIYAMRMLGLFLILPVFALYAEHLGGATPLLVGLAIGAYGLTQALLQIPFGMLSDRIGRKPVIVFGLLLFAAGSALAAVATEIWLVVLGRALQGSGAIAAAVMALLADLTRESQRTKAMALIGMTIGLSFTVALMAGPLLNELWGVPGIFWLVAVLALAGIGIVLFVVPTPARSTLHRDAEVVGGEFGAVLRDGQLLRLDFGIVALHMVRTSLFLAVPLELRDEAGLASVAHWQVYLPAMLLAVATMVPFIVLAERYGRMKGVFLGAVVVLGVAQLGLYAQAPTVWGIAFWVYAFFVGFNLLERWSGSAPAGPGTMPGWAGCPLSGDAAVLAAALGLVERRVRPLEHGLGDVVAPELGEPAGDGDLDRPVAGVQPGAGHRDPHLVRDLEPAVQRGADQQDRELLAAVAGDEVGPAQPAPERLGDDPQGLVAGRVAEAVVDRLEVVDVEDRKGQRRAEPAPARVLLREPLVPGLAVWQLGHRVDHRALLHQRDLAPQVGRLLLQGAELLAQRQLGGAGVTVALLFGREVVGHPALDDRQVLGDRRA